MSKKYLKNVFQEKIIKRNVKIDSFFSSYFISKTCNIREIKTHTFSTTKVDLKKFAPFFF